MKDELRTLSPATVGYGDPDAGVEMFQVGIWWSSRSFVPHRNTDLLTASGICWSRLLKTMGELHWHNTSPEDLGAG